MTEMSDDPFKIRKILAELLDALQEENLIRPGTDDGVFAWLDAHKGIFVSVPQHSIEPGKPVMQVEPRTPRLPLGNPFNTKSPVSFEGYTVRVDHEVKFVPPEADDRYGLFLMLQDPSEGEG